MFQSAWIFPEACPRVPGFPRKRVPEYLPVGKSVTQSTHPRRGKLWITFVCELEYLLSVTQSACFCEPEYQPRQGCLQAGTVRNIGGHYTLPFLDSKAA